MFKVFNYISDIEKDLLKEDKKVRIKAARHVRNRIAKKLRTNKTPGSEPGGIPGKVTGNLLKSLKARSGKTVAYVGSTVPLGNHAHILEFGSRDVKPRPILSTTMMEEAGAVERILRDRDV